MWVGWREDVDQNRGYPPIRRHQDADAMLALMHRIPVSPGDGVLVPGGTPHAIGAGILLIEAQEPSDQSILLERTNTAASDAEVFLGLDRDTALSVVDTEALVDPGRLIRHADDGTVLPEEAAPFFRMDLLGAGTDVQAGFAVGVVLTGCRRARLDARRFARRQRRADPRRPGGRR